MSADLARRGDALAHGGAYPPAGQLPPVGPLPTAEVLMLGALLWPRSGVDPRPVLALVADDDVADPAVTAVLQTIRAMIAAGWQVGPALVADELQRHSPSRPARDRLREAASCGALPEALPGYACAVVARSLRRRFDSAGTAFVAAAESMAEADLAPMAERAVASVLDCAARLEKLRGGEG